MIDYLSQRDGTAARQLAELLLQFRPEEPGEWTLAMRELARGRTVDSWPDILTSRLHEFLVDSEWASMSPRSWLEGFDLAVAGRPNDFLSDLAGVVARSGGSRGSRFAAFLAADRMSLNRPAQTMELLNSAPALLSENPNVRAGIFARADVRDPAQLRVLESYLARGDISNEERKNFSETFPLYDVAVSRNLLTTVQTRPMSDMMAQDRATVRWIDQSMGSVGNGDWNESLKKIRGRLSTQLEQTGS